VDNAIHYVYFNMQDAAARSRSVYWQHYAVCTALARLVEHWADLLDYHANVYATDLDDSFQQKHSYSDDMRAFCPEYKEEQLFRHIPRRKHHSFPSRFVFDMSLDGR